jgi:cell wall-associated NlpC family hydrolase
MIKISDLIGKPFKDGGRGPDSYDCYGLVKEVYHRLGIELPDLYIHCFDIEKINGEYQLQSHHLMPIEKPELYCIIVMINNATVINHFGVYLGNHEFIHAIPDANVCKGSIDHPRWKRAIEGYCRWVG